MQRARKAEDKEGRRRLILGAARELWARATYATFNMAEVAERAGLAKGTVYIYFATKEALLLDLLHEELAGWRDVLYARLDQGCTWSPELTARPLAGPRGPVAVVERGRAQGPQPTGSGVDRRARQPGRGPIVGMGNVS